MECHQLPESLVAERIAADALVHVGVGAAVGFDDGGAVAEDRHVPADDVAVVERGVSALGERAGLSPQRQDTAFDLAAGIGVVRLPAVARPEAPVGGGAERAGGDVDRRSDAAGVECRQAIVADAMRNKARTASWPPLSVRMVTMRAVHRRRY
jgi:hypothetical protein